ncbi:Tudor domain-containing protein [Trichinella pseudospiralis]
MNCCINTVVHRCQMSAEIVPFYDYVQRAYRKKHITNANTGILIDFSELDPYAIQGDFSPHYEIPDFDVHQYMEHGKAIYFDVAYVKQIEHFYIQPIIAKDKYFLRLYELLQEIYTLSCNQVNLPIKLSSFEKPVYGVVKYYDGTKNPPTFMRCQVLNIVDMELGSSIQPKTVRVKLIDYGANYICNASEVYQIDKRLCDIPCFTFQCCLEGVVRIQRKDLGGKAFFADHLQWFRWLCNSVDPFKGFLDCDVRERSFKVLMFAKKSNWYCVNRMLLQNGYGRPVENSLLLSWNMLLNGDQE